MIWPHLVPGWTINYEMAFYFLFAMTMLAGKYKRLAMLGALCLTVLLGQFLVNSSGTAATTFYTSPLILEFGFGIALFSINNSWSFRAPAWMWWILAGVSGAMLLLPNTIHRAFADGIPALVLLFSLIQIKSGVKSKILHFLGDASYSIYLFHLFGLELIEKIIRSLSPVLPVDSLSSPLLVIRLVVAVAIGGMIHVMLEKPLTQALKSASLWKPQHRGHNPASSVSGVVPLTNSVVSGQLAASIAQTTLRPSGFSIRDFTNLEMPVHHDFGSGTNPVRLPARLLRVPQRAVV
jgi:peptidoglycan/LPS O-acetylase OafA/YrhL